MFPNEAVSYQCMTFTYFTSTIAFALLVGTGCAATSDASSGDSSAALTRTETVSHDFAVGARPDAPSVLAEAKLREDIAPLLAPFSIELTSEAPISPSLETCTMSLRQSATEKRLARWSKCGFFGEILQVSRVLTDEELAARTLVAERQYWTAGGKIYAFDKPTVPVAVRNWGYAFFDSGARITTFTFNDASAGARIEQTAAQLAGFDTSIFGAAWMPTMRLRSVNSYIDTSGKVARQIAWADRDE